MPHASSRWNKRKRDKGEGGDRARVNKGQIDQAVASSAGRGQAGVDEGNESKASLQRDPDA